jgi:hypothetical protein
MGASSEFKCESCGYSTVVAGGKSVGMIVVVETMLCGGCSELVDVVVSERFPDILSFETDRGAGQRVCPNCGSADVVIWDNARPCPKCGEQVSEGEIAVLWD